MDTDRLIATWPRHVTIEQVRQLPGLQHLGLYDVQRLPGFPLPSPNQMHGQYAWDRRHVRAWWRRRQP